MGRIKEERDKVVEAIETIEIVLKNGAAKCDSPVNGITYYLCLGLIFTA